MALAMAFSTVIFTVSSKFGSDMPVNSIDHTNEMIISFVGERLGLVDGLTDGEALGDVLGLKLGADGLKLGLSLGLDDGIKVGAVSRTRASISAAPSTRA